jgi:hypothetical protein
LSVVLSYPWWFLSFCLIAGACYALALYFKSKKNSGVNNLLTKALAAVRFITVSILCFLLLSPLIKNVFRKVEKPIIVVVRDNSMSIPLNSDSSYYRNIFPKQIDEFSSGLGKDYEVVVYNFGSDLQSQSPLDYSEKITNISAAMDDIKLRYLNRNLGAIVLASDGLYNQGLNPVYDAASLKAPVYTVALGDTSIKRDALVKEVAYNKVVFLGNQFPIDISVVANKLQGTNTTLSVTHNGKSVFSKSLSINGNKYSNYSSCTLTADAPGTQRYRISITKVEGEATVLNNYYDIFIDVIDSRQKILILTEFPHPDIAAWQQAINQNKNYQSEIGLVPGFNKNLRDYSLVIVHQLPTTSNNASTYINQITTQQIPVIYTLGNSTNVQSFNALNTGLKVVGNRNNTDDIQGTLNSNFSLFSLSENVSKYFAKLPPLSGPYGSSFEISPTTEIMAFRKVGTVTTTYPLICFTNNNKHKIGVIAGEGIWKWRNYDYAAHNNHEIFFEVINKMIQYTAVKEDKSFFRVNSAQQFYENEPIILFAELYNESYELLNEPDVKLDIFSEANAKYSYIFSKVGKSYRLSAGILPVGEYRYEGSVQYKGKNLKKLGKFIVKPIQLEALNTSANHDMLNKLSVSTEGKLYYPQQLNELKNELINSKEITSVAYKQKQLRDLIYYKWLFFVILFLLGLEWFVRKREGLA